MVIITRLFWKSEKHLKYWKYSKRCVRGSNGNPIVFGNLSRILSNTLRRLSADTVLGDNRCIIIACNCI